MFLNPDVYRNNIKTFMGILWSAKNKNPEVCTDVLKCILHTHFLYCRICVWTYDKVMPDWGACPPNHHGAQAPMFPLAHAKKKLYFRFRIKCHPGRRALFS